MKSDKLIEESAIAFKEMTYAIKGFARAAIHAKNATNELFQIFDEIEQIKKEKRRLKRKQFWEKLKFWEKHQNHAL